MTAVLTPRQIKADFLAVLKTGSGSASVAARAALGAGANSVIVRKQLQLTLPRAPFAVLAWGPVTGQVGFPRQFYLTWFLYDDVDKDWYALNGLASLIEAAYPDDALPACYTNYAGGIGEETYDKALQNRPVIALRYQVSGRF